MQLCLKLSNINVNVNHGQCVFYTFIPHVNLELHDKDNETYVDIVGALTLLKLNQYVAFVQKKTFSKLYKPL
jgi:hypothetical protein